ncbi:Zinc finger C2H2-type, partial [Trinorchestia longiramus]
SSTTSSTSRKPYGLHCPVCYKWSSSRADLKKHLRSHTGERPFNCHICPYSATVKCNLRRHLFTVHRFDMASS